MLIWFSYRFLLVLVSSFIFMQANHPSVWSQNDSGSRGRFNVEPAEESEIIGKSNKYAVIVGVNEYGEYVSDLSGCINDAKALAKAFQEKGFEVTLLTDDSAIKPTKQTIEKAVNEMCQKAKPTDTILFSFAGHGAVSPDSLKKSGQLPEGYLLPRNFSNTSSFEDEGVPIQYIKEQFYSAKAQFRLMFMDACQSGSQLIILPGRNDDGTMSENMLASIRGADQEESQERGIYIFSSCLQNQLAYESKSINHGYFTNFVVEGLEGKAADYEGEVSVYSLVDYVSKHTQQTVMEEKKKRQTPQLLSEGIRMVLGQVPPSQVPYPKPTDVVTVTALGYSYLSDGVLAKYNAIHDAYATAVYQVLSEVNNEVENYPKSLDYVLNRASQFIINKRSENKITSTQTVDDQYYEVEIQAEVDKKHLLSVAAQQGLIPYDVMREHDLIHEIKAGLYIPESSRQPEYDERLRENISAIFDRLKIPFVRNLHDPVQDAQAKDCNLIIETTYKLEAIAKRGKLFQSSLTMGIKSFPASSQSVSNREWIASMDTETVTGLGISQGEADDEAFNKMSDSVESFVNQTIHNLMQQ